MLEIGSLIDGKYKILSEIGHGGMSVVYLAINERANKTWAVKEVRKDGVSDFEAVRQGLIVETDMLKKLHHPNLPSIIDVIDSDDSFLIVMDYVEGKSLQKVMELNGPQPVDVVVNWGKQLCDVLGYLHNQDPPIIYRDMKPSNVMLKPDGNVTLIDFGTAREFKYRDMVQDTVVLGTRGYAPPEQYGGAGQTDARSDIYSLGATIYYLLTGHSPALPPYEIKRLRYWDMRFAGTGLEKIVDKCCQQDANMRFQSTAELYYALDHAQDEDNDAIRSRNAKWYSFVFSLIVVCLGIIGMIGFGTAKKMAQENSYAYYIEQAEKSAIFEEVLSYCKSAVEVRPEEDDAYRVLYNAATEDFDSRALQLIALMDTSEVGSNRNVEYLMNRDRASYDWLQYHIGFGYVFLTNEPNWSKGAAYFSTVLDSEYLSEQERTIAQISYNIGANFSQLGGASGKNNSGLSDGDEYTYSDFWKALSEMVTAENLEKLDRPDYRLVICKLAATYINDLCVQFKSYGISEQELTDMLNLVTQITEKNYSEMPNIQILYDRADQAIGAARRQVGSVYQASMGGN